MDAWLARAARENGSRVALRTADGPRVTYAQLHATALEVAGGLRERGVARGDRVALALPSEEFVVALHACLLIGAAAVPIDLRLTAKERARRSAGARLELTSLEGVAAPLSAPEPTRPEEVATVMFTSGTTAGPKEVALTLDNWLGNAIGSALALGLDRHERWLCPMPLAHVGGLSIQLRSVVYQTEVLLHGRYETDAVLAALADPAARVTLVSLVPTMLSRLLDAGLREPPTLRWALLGGGPIAPALLQRAACAGVPVAPSYGMTEAGSQIATFGRPLFGTELSLGADGEILVRGRTVAAGALSPDGWLHTGDLGRLDSEGRLEIVGRLADTIVTGGENVAPAEIEAVLMAHPAVADAAVLGRSDPEWGEAVVARVVLAPGAPAPTSDELRRFCATRLAPFKVPKRFEPVDAVPRGVTGKLLRRELR
ncbi:MAG TPA: AMP-binding protein [Solirubrobacteraceae bacterium]|nr:AMP-binding protein [Solirubrobacteraceae bacterium]